MTNNKKKHFITDYLKGFTIPELLTSLVIIAIAFLGIMTLYMEVIRHHTQDQIIEEIRFSLSGQLDQIVAEIKSADSIDYQDSYQTTIIKILSVDGNGNWSGNPLAHINLPFTFKFYGISYDDITVSPNGWITLGDTDMESFRNYPIPGAGGPSPMIAGFWDDLETSNSGDVFIYNTGDSFIVEWSEMRTENNNSIETFQMILFNDSPPPYGDNSIKVQYKEFNNTSVGDYPVGRLVNLNAKITICVDSSTINDDGGIIGLRSNCLVSCCVNCTARVDNDGGIRTCLDCLIPSFSYCGTIFYG